MNNQKEFVESLFSKKERKKLWVLPAITNGEIDLEKERVVTWIHPSGHIGYVVYNDGGNFTAFMMDRLSDKSKSKKVVMCAWCLSIKPSANMTMFSRPTSDNSCFSVGLCAELNCLSSIRNINPDTMPETLTREQKEQRYFHNLESYISTYVRGKHANRNTGDS